MDKNMINIDDLIKQRLSGGEEPEMPGSWMRMKELLDKEKPERRIGGFYWRRMLGVMSGLVLLSVLTVGSYKYVSTRFSNGDEKAIAAANTQTRMHAPTHQSGQGGIVSRADQNDSRSIAATSGNLTGNKAEVATRNTSISGHKEGQKQTVNAKLVVKDNLPASTGVATDNATPKSNAVASKLNNGRQVPVQQANVVTQQMAAEKISAIPSNSANQLIDNQNTSKPKTAPVINNSNNVFASNTTPNTANNSLGDTQIQPLQNLAAAADNTRLSSVPAPQQPDQPRDTVNKMTIVQRYKINPLTRVSKLTNDTLGIEKITIEKPIATASVVSNSTGKVDEADMKLNAAAPSAASTSSSIGMNESMVPLSNYKVGARRTSKWNARSFDDVVRDVKFNLAQTKFYPGISAGVNSYLFGPNNIGGFQLGLFGLLTFGDTWGGMVELKYIQRFNNGSTIKDNYYDVQGTQGSYMEREVQSFFKFSSVQSIEMPIALRYAAGRLNVLGGINLAYNFAVNAERAQVKDPNFHPTTSPNFGNTRPTIDYPDFDARFSFGGLLGVSYSMTPSLQADFRVSKNFWDNAPTAGGEKVSQALFRAPSFQLSLFYRFNQRNQIPRAK